MAGGALCAREEPDDGFESTRCGGSTAVEHPHISTLGDQLCGMGSVKRWLECTRARSRSANGCQTSWVLTAGPRHGHRVRVPMRRGALRNDECRGPNGAAVRSRAVPSVGAHMALRTAPTLPRAPREVRFPRRMVRHSIPPSVRRATTWCATHEADSERVAVIEDQTRGLRSFGRARGMIWIAGRWGWCSGCATELPASGGRAVARGSLWAAGAPGARAARLVRARGGEA